MGKFNEIQEEVKQSFGSNSFTTTVKEDTVEFDSAKDSFTFKDEVNVPSLKIDGEAVQAGPADWNDLKNKPFYETEKSLWGDQVIRLAGNQLEGADELGRVYFTPAKTIKPGDSFTVIIGNEYKMVVNVAGTDETGGGGGSLVNIETGLPGLGGGSIVYSDYGQSGAIQLGADPATVSGELSCMVEVVKQIDSKYVPTPDWNASEGEPGYIENRICYEEEMNIWGPEDLTIGNDGQIVGHDNQGNYYFNLTREIKSNESLELKIGEYIGTFTFGVVVSGSTSGGGSFTDDQGQSFGGGSISFGPAYVSKPGYNAYISISTNPAVSSGKSLTCKVNVVSKSIDKKFISKDTLAFEHNYNGNRTTVTNFGDNKSNTIVATDSLLLFGEYCGANGIGGGYNTVLGNTSSNTVDGQYNLLISNHGSHNLAGMNTAIISQAGGHEIASTESYSAIIMGSYGVKLSGGGYNKLALNAMGGSEITGSDSDIICGAAKISGYNSFSLGNHSWSSTITADHSFKVGTGSATIGGSNNAFVSAGGGNTLNGSFNTILGGGGGNNLQGGYCCTMNCSAVSMPSNISYTTAIGMTNITIDESNMVYVPDLKVKVGDRSYKFSEIVTALKTAGMLE